MSTTLDFIPRLLKGTRPMPAAFTNEKGATAQMLESEPSLKAIFEHGSVGMALVSPDGHWLKANGALCALLGRTEGELLCLTVSDVTHPDDVELSLGHERDVVAGDFSSYHVEKRYIHKSGSVITALLCKSLVRDGHNQPSHFVAQIQDITERTRNEDAVRRSQDRLRALIDGMGPSIFVGLLTPEGILVEVNQAPLTAGGLKADDVLGKPFDETPWWSHSPSAQQLLREAIEKAARGEASRFDVRTRGAENVDIDIDFSLQPLRDSSGNVVFLIPSASVITERKQAETALRESEAEFRGLAESMPQMVWITRADGWTVYFNQQWMDYTGLTLEESLGHGWNKPFHADDQQSAWDAWNHATATCGTYSIESRLRRADGTYRWWLVRGVPQLNAAGQILKWFGTCTDIHDLKLAQLEVSHANQALKQQHNELRVLFDIMPAMVWYKDTKNGFLRVNQRVAEATGMAIEEIEGRSAYEIFPQEAEGYYADDLEVIGSAAPKLGIVEQLRGPNGEALWVQTDKMPVCDQDGKVTGLVAMVHDITQRKRADEALQASEKRFKALFEQAAVGVAQSDAVTGRFVQVNQRFCDIVGRSRSELEELTFSAIIAPVDMGSSLEVARQLLRGNIRECASVTRYLRKDRSEVWADVTVSAMWAPGEVPDFVIAVVQDVTARKVLEEQLRQSQKMEAVGTLAGGIAHDFNNILAAITGYAELARMTLKDNPMVREHLGAVVQASNRAAALVQQILAFSRQQKPERVVLQVWTVVEECLKLLRATTPSTIEFDTLLATDVPRVRADATQILQILMNLATNAVYAIGEHPGRIRVALERCVVDAAHATAQPRLHVGLYARLSLSDSGCGMDGVTLRRVFEPFFTTKPPGEGTGLGLAVVHGIMESHDGAVTVYSEPGEGTVFHLYFPAQEDAAAVHSTEEEVMPRGHGERVLLVDDEELLVRLGHDVLSALGYEVEVTSIPAEALARVRADPQRFRLVVTDQTMPGMTGLELVSKLREIRPELPVILTSGYSLSLTPERVAAAGIHTLLLKPTTIHSLGTAVQAALRTTPLG